MQVILKMFSWVSIMNPSMQWNESKNEREGTEGFKRILMGLI